MVEMHQEYVGDIEVIHAMPAGGYASPLPTLFFYHGYISSKEIIAISAMRWRRPGSV